MPKAWLVFMLTMSLLPFGLNPNATAQDDEELVPEWVKNNAEWYAEGLITEEDFIQGIKFLLDNNIIFLDQESAGEIRSLREKIVELEEELNQCLNRSAMPHRQESTKDCYVDEDGNTVCKICSENKDGEMECWIESSQRHFDDEDFEEREIVKDCFVDEDGETVCKICELVDGEETRCWEEGQSPREDIADEGEYEDDEGYEETSIQRNCFKDEDGNVICKVCELRDGEAVKCWEEKESR